MKQAGTIPDQKALKILFETYFCSKGGERVPKTKKADLLYAKKMNLMFDPVEMSHDKVVRKCSDEVANISKEVIVAGFVCSLSTKRLDWRSALGSYAVFQNLQLHKFQPWNGEKNCAICGLYKGIQEYDLSIYNFERFKWGGVRFDDPSFAMFDLEQFAKQSPFKPTSEDYKILKGMIAALRNLDSQAKLKDAEKAIASVIPSNKEERRMILRILGYCGILQNPDVPNFLHGFVPLEDRAEPRAHKQDWLFPISWWSGKNGVNESAVRFWFPNL